MHDIDLIDDLFLLRLTDTYHLSVQTSLSGLSFAVLDLSKLRYIALRHYPFDGLENPGEIYDYLSGVYHEDNILSRDFKSISHAFVGNKSTIIPQKDFNINNADIFMHFLYTDIEKQVTNYNVLPAIQSYNAFTYPNVLFSKVTELFKDVKLFHHTTPIITSLVADSTNLSGQICYIFLSNGTVHIGIAKNAKLLFFNCFDYKNKSDLAYFILSILEQFNMPAKSANVNISSDTKDHDEIFDFLNNYLGEIHFIKPSDKFTYSILFDELHLTQFVNLFNLALCE
jgi:hypothetical protein